MLGPDDARNVCIDGTVQVRDVLTLRSADVETWDKWCVGSEDLFLGYFQAHCQAEATSEMAIELPLESK